MKIKPLEIAQPPDIFCRSIFTTIIIKEPSYMKEHSVAIAYRIYPGVDENHYLLDGWGKYELSKACLSSFIKSLSNVNYKLYAILDDCPDKYVQLFKDLVPQDRLDINHFPGIGNEATFNKQLDILMGQKFSEKVYFAEDDYLYIEGVFHQILEFLHNDGVDFVTPYDHPDYYGYADNSDMPDHLDGLHDYKSDILFQNRHWRTVSSTTCTFLTTKETLNDTEGYLRLYSQLSDYGMWISLTKKRMTHFDIRRTILMYIILRSKLLFGELYTLWSPMPTIATHMETDYLAQGVDWENVLTEASQY